MPLSSRASRPATPPPTSRPWQALLWPLSWASLLCAVLLLLAARAADAALTPASVIEGPSSSILDVDGAALAPDGSGGIVYRKLVDNQPHLFVARFLGGAWQAPVEVDDQASRSAPPSRLSPLGMAAVCSSSGSSLGLSSNQVTQYELMSAELSPGASNFGPVEEVDPNNLGDGTAAFPAVAMAPNGNAYVVYRVVTDSFSNGISSVVPLRPGDELMEVRVAHYNGPGLAWSALGRDQPVPAADDAPTQRNQRARHRRQQPRQRGRGVAGARRDRLCAHLGATNLRQHARQRAVGQSDDRQRTAVDVDADGLALSVSPWARPRPPSGSPAGPARPTAASASSSTRCRPSPRPTATSSPGRRCSRQRIPFGAPSVSLSGSGGTGAYRLAYTAGATHLFADRQRLRRQRHAAARSVAPKSEEVDADDRRPRRRGVTVWRATGSPACR